MITALQCPICNRMLGQNEALVVSHDAIGTLIVHHMIPADIPLDTGSEVDSVQEKLKKHPQTNLRLDFTSREFTPMRSYCGQAGYKGVLWTR